MDRVLSTLCYLLAFGCGCTAGVLAFDGLLEYLGGGRWPDRSLLRLGYDSGLVRARWFLVQDWAMPLRDVLAALPAAVALLATVPVWWWLGSRLAR